MDRIPTILCEKGQSMLAAAELHGYTSPLHRIGVVHDARPLDKETLVARVKVGRHSLPLPIFERENKRGGDEQCVTSTEQAITASAAAQVVTR